MIMSVLSFHQKFSERYTSRFNSFNLNVNRWYQNLAEKISELFRIYNFYLA